MNAYEFVVKMRDMASATLRNVAQSVGGVRSSIANLTNSISQNQRAASNMANTYSKIKSLLASVFAVGVMIAFTHKVVEARSEYEKFNAVLANTFQSDAIGAAALNMLTDFAARTPFQLNELTGAFVKLVNRGFAPTSQELTKLGDLASSQGKSFDQLTEAILDAQSGEFERLKEFGIKASKNGEKVTLAFKGVTKEINNNESAIRNALIQYGEMTGVAGSMEAISQTLGGKISNLEDQWNSFLVAVGGESAGLFTAALIGVSEAIEFLTIYLPYVSMWFELLWTMIEPVVVSLQVFIKVAFGISRVSDILGTFGNIMAGVLVVVGWFTTGLNNIITLLSPFAREILIITAAWWLWNNAIGIYNALMLVNPTTWIVLGIIALIMVIGMVIKYTSGWGDSWRHTVNGAKLLWETFGNFISANWNNVTSSLMNGIDKIKMGWYKFKEAVGMGDSSENQKMLAQLNSDIEARKKAIADGYQKMNDNFGKAKNEFGQIAIKVDTEGIKKDFKGIKDKFSGLGQKDGSTAAYDDYLSKQKGASLGKDKTDGKDKKDSIVSGGSKITHITINIEKLQDDTKIYVESTEKGLNNLGEKVQEMLLRAVNSVNQMQTG